MNYCNYCSQPCGEREFCDETCFGEYKSEMNALDDGYHDELPGESSHDYLSWGEPEEWDVVGGL